MAQGFAASIIVAAGSLHCLSGHGRWRDEEKTKVAATMIEAGLVDLGGAVCDPGKAERVRFAPGPVLSASGLQL